MSTLDDDIRERLELFEPPEGGGRYRDPEATEQLLVRMSHETLTRLELLAEHFTDELGRQVYPMQIAGVLLELCGELKEIKDASGTA